MKNIVLATILAALLLTAVNAMAAPQSPSTASAAATAPALVSLSFSQTPLPSSGQVTITAVFTDPQGVGDIRRYYLGLSNCTLAAGDAYSSNFERNLANFFGVYSHRTGSPSVARYNSPAACTGGQYSGQNPWLAGLPGANASGTATLISQTEQVSGSNLSVSWVLQLNNFPVGTYYAYYMVEDQSLTWQTGSSAAWWRSLTIQVSQPPTPTATRGLQPTATRTPTPTKTAYPTKTPTPTPPPNNPPGLLTLSLDHQPARRNDTVTLSARFYDPQGGATISQVYLGISDCTLSSGEDSSSNFERRLADFFGGLFYPLSGMKMMAKNNAGSACTGGIYGLSPWSSSLPLANVPKTVSLQSVSSTASGVYLDTTWKLSLNNFPPGVYSLYSMARDTGGLYTSGSTASWSRSALSFEVLPPPQPRVEAIWLGGLLEPSIQVAEGESFRLKIRAANLASPAGVGENAALIVSFPGQDADFLQLVGCTDATSPGLACMESLGTGKVPMVTAGKAQWPGGESNILELLITAEQAGMLDIQVRLVMDQAPDRYVDPQESAQADLVGNPVYARSVEVLPRIDPLGRVNYYRSQAGLDPVSFLTTWNEACGQHAAYLAENNLLTHQEDPANPWYSLSGAAAGQASNLALIEAPDVHESLPVDLWMASPFHALSILDPRWQVSGFAAYRNQDRTGACLDVARGLDFLAEVTWPVYWPPADGVTSFTRYTGQASPDPLAPCPGYTTPSGPPILLLTGDGRGAPQVSAHRFLANGQELEHCLFTETSYTNPDPAQQSSGRNLLGQRDAVALIPREPLSLGQVYSVELAVNGQPVTWSFQVAPGGLENLSGAVAPGQP